MKRFPTDFQHSKSWKFQFSISIIYLPKKSTYKYCYADIFLSARFAIFQTNGEFLTKFDQSVRYILSMYIGAIDLFTKVFYTIYIAQSVRN